MKIATCRADKLKTIDFDFSFNLLNCDVKLFGKLVRQILSSCLWLSVFVVQRVLERLSEEGVGRFESNRAWPEGGRER